MRNTILFVLVAATLESGCGAKLPSMKPYKLDIQQGNVVTSKMLLQLRPGMTRSQVRYIMGTPLVVDSFHDNRWDYFFELRQQGQVVEKRRVILDFDNDRLVSVRGDVIPSAENPDVKTIAETPVKNAAPENATAESDESWTDKLKFWKSDEAKPAASASSEAVDTASAAVAAKADSAPVQPTANAPSSGSESSIQNEIVPPISEGEYTADATKTADKAAVNLASDKANVSGSAGAAEMAVVPAATAVVAAQSAKPENASSASSASSKVQGAEAKSASVTPSAAEEDEVIPYIPEGEYVAPVVPTPEEMVKGNASHTNEPMVDASTSSVTEKGVAPDSAKETSDAPPVFIPEQMPEQVAEPEPELPAPPSKSAIAAQTTTPPLEQKPLSDQVEAASTPEQTSSMQQAQEMPVTENASTVISEAPAAVPAPVVMPEPVKVSMDDAEIDQAVNRWARAWREKDLTAYFSAYSPNFVPESMATKKAWEAQRKQRLSTKQGAITLVLSNIRISRDGQHAVVQFDQKYAAKSYSDNTAKILEMDYASDQKTWLITRERTGKELSTSVAMETAVPEGVTVGKEEAKTDSGQSVATTLPGVDVAIQNWAEAWRSKNVTDYLNAYAPDFIPEGQLSRKAWETQRKQRLSPKQGVIELELSDLRVQQDGDDAIAHFKQKYSAKAYSDEMMKELQLHFDPAKKAWLITRETQFKGVDTFSDKHGESARAQDLSPQVDVPVEPTGF